MCNRSLKQTAISLSSCEAEFYAASVCVGELLGLAELFKELHCNVSVRLEMDSDSAIRLGKIQTTAQGTRQIQTYRNTMPCNTTGYSRETSICESSGREEQHCRTLYETSGWSANAVARKETWTSNPGWYEWYEWERLRNGDDLDLLNSASSRAGV